jgi:hypothetical protein
MARWRLRCNHYLNVVERWEWEYKQVNRKTGREDRMRWQVPRLLDVKEPSDWTSKPDGVSVARGGSFDEVDGIIVVCHEGKGKPGDIEFRGDPTPDMDPLDDEARAISASFGDRWAYKPESAEISHSQSLIERFDVEMAATRDKANAPQQLVIPGLEDLVKQMALIIASNAELVKRLSDQPQPRRL